MPRGVRYPQLQDREWLRRRYEDVPMSASAIADELGCSINAVNNMLHQHRIPTRSRREAKAIAANFKTRRCDHCGRQFLPKSGSARYCSLQCRASGTPVTAAPRHTDFPQLQDAEWLRATYEQPRSGPSIAGELGCDTQLVYYWLNKHGIPRRNNLTRTAAYVGKDCQRCGTFFMPTAPAQLFCAKQCAKEKPYECGECGGTFWSRIRGLRKSEQYYGIAMCSTDCRVEARRKWLTSRTTAHLANSDLAGTGPLPSDQPIRRKDASGYVRIAVPPDYPTSAADGWMAEHRFVMEQHLGRHLWPLETVHHVNGKKSDNRIENLQLRQGQHGKGAAFRCNTCGSHDITAVELADPET